MNKLNAIKTIVLLCLVTQLTNAQNVGIGTTSPNAKLDVNGSIATREGTAVPLVNGANANLALAGNFSFYRISGPTGAFTISGIAGGIDGKMLTLVNGTGQSMTLQNQNSGSTSANQINTLNGNDMILQTGGSVTLHYNATLSKWVITGNHGADAPNTAQLWNLKGNAGTNSGNSFVGTTDNVSIRVRTNNTERMVVDSTGKVGMGITAPATNLNVTKATAAAPATSGTASTAIARFDAQNNALDMGAYTASPYGNWIQATTVNDLSVTQPIALNPNGGSVGIATATPSQKLEVSGNNQTVRIGGLTSTVANQFATAGTQTMYVTNNGDLTVTKPTATPTNDINWSILGNTGISSSNYIGTTDNAYLRFKTYGVSRMTIDSLGKIGMGITAPATNLNVYKSTAAAPATTGTASTAIARFEAQNNALDMGAFTAAPYGSWIQATSVADLSVNSVLALNPNGGYVGIGTAAPANHLEIINNGGGNGAVDDMAIKSYGASTSPQFIFQSATGTAAAPANLTNGTDLGKIAFWGQNGGSANIMSQIYSKYTGNGTTNASEFQITTSGIEHMRLDSLGRIMHGINAAVYPPLTAMHFYGDGTSGYTAGGTTEQPAPHAGPEIGFARGGYTQGVGAAIQFIDYDAYSGGLAFLVHKGQRNNAGGAFADNWPTDVINAMTIVSNGQIGIGTTDPTAIFHTIASGAKTAAYTGNLLTNVATSSTASINKAGVEIKSTGTWNGASASNIGLYVSSVTGGTTNYDAIFNGGGNVGIGTIAPTQKLEVAGTVKMQSLQGKVRSISSVTTLDNTDYFVVVSGGSTFNLTLPSPSAVGAGHTLSIRAIKTGGSVTIVSNSGSQIIAIGSTAASANFVLGNTAATTMISDGTSWYRLF